MKAYTDYTAAERHAYAVGLAEGVTCAIAGQRKRVQRRFVVAGVLTAGLTLATSAVRRSR